MFTLCVHHAVWDLSGCAAGPCRGAGGGRPQGRRPRAARCGWSCCRRRCPARSGSSSHAPPVIVQYSIDSKSREQQ